MKRDVISVSVEPIDPELYRRQELQACEAAWIGLQNNAEPQLRWFCTSILHLPPTWTPYVGMALWKPDSKGEPAWKSAEHPFAVLATVTRRAVLRWNPVLLFGANTDRVFRPQERAISTLRLGIAEDSDWRDDPFGYLAYRWYDGRDEEERDPWKWAISEELYLHPPQDGLHFNWTLIGYRAGLPDDEIALMKARCRGFTRVTADKHLGWPEHRVQAVWRRLTRHLDDDELVRRLEKVLTGEITEPPEKNLWKTSENVSPDENWLYVVNRRADKHEKREQTWVTQ
jgi:hypothetical protein